MKKINKILPLFKILIFAIVFILIFEFITYLFKPNNYNLTNITGFYGEKKNTLDMVYIGGSACFVYWEPLSAYSEHGIASYNYAADTIQPELYKYLIGEILKHQNPEVIVVDARAFQYRDDDQPPTEVAYRNILTGSKESISKVITIEKIVRKYLHKDPLSYHFDIIKYHTRYKEKMYPRTSLKMMFNRYENPNKGFYFVPKVVDIPQYEFDTSEEAKLSSDTDYILEDLLEYMKKTKKKFVFIVSPYSETIEHKKIYNYVERRVKEEGFDFIDANEHFKEMNLDSKHDFYHVGHVNIFGADKYTNFLARYLINNYNLPDRRNEEFYKEKWECLLPDWNNQTTNVKNKITELLK